MDRQDRRRALESGGEGRRHDHQPALPVVPIRVEVKDRRPVRQPDQHPEDAPSAGRIEILLARRRVAVEVQDVDLEPALPEELRELLDVDREYREKAAAGTLHRIAPRRFNPSHEAWLPVMHTQRGERHYTALFSNTARAHQLGQTRDWVILYYDDGTWERQCTVITAQRDPLKGQRIVRGRESDCEAYYKSKVQVEAKV